MALLMMTLAWLPHVLPGMSELPRPAHVTLTSSHFIHMLKWESGQRTPEGASYRVSVTTERGTSWDPVAGCEALHPPLVCNLTEAFSDPTQFYITKITAALGAQTSQPVFYPPFKPIKDTQLDLPLVNVTACNGTLCVDLLPPVESLREIYDSLHYQLRISSANHAQPFFKDMGSLRGGVLEELAPGRQYCVSIRFSDSLEQRESNYSQPVCAVTPASHTANTDALTPALSCLLLVSAVSAALSGCFICLKKRPLPSVLTSIHHMEEVLVFTPCSPPLSSLLICEMMLHSPDGKRSSHALSNKSFWDSDVESTGGRTAAAAAYKSRAGTTHLSSSSSSSSGPVSPEPAAQHSFSLNPTSDLSYKLEATLLIDTDSNAGSQLGLSAHTGSDQYTQYPCLPAGTLSVHGGRTDPIDGDGEVVGGVDLLTLTFGRHDNHGEKNSSYPGSSSAPAVYSPTALSHSQTAHSEHESCSVDEDEDEEEEHSGYMGR